MKVTNKGSGNEKSVSAAEMQRALFIARAREGLTSRNLRAKNVYQKPSEKRREAEKQRIRTIQQKKRSS